MDEKTFHELKRLNNMVCANEKRISELEEVIKSLIDPEYDKTRHILYLDNLYYNVIGKFDKYKR